MADDLSDLIARVERAEGPDRELGYDVCGSLLNSVQLGAIFLATHGDPATSLDAALALCERVLPDAYVGVQQNWAPEGNPLNRTWSGYVCIGQNGVEHEGPGRPTAALALLLAALRALHAQGGGNG